MSPSASAGARSRARELVVQALYQRQIAGHDVGELLQQFRDRPEFARVDRTFFNEALTAIVGDAAQLEDSIGEFADRPLSQLDPVERGVLLLGFYELRERPEVPFKVVINESVNLARKFGAVDGHKYINALLDRAARTLRSES